MVWSVLELLYTVTVLVSLFKILIEYWIIIIIIVELSFFMLIEIKVKTEVSILSLIWEKYYFQFLLYSKSA